MIRLAMGASREMDCPPPLSPTIFPANPVLEGSLLTGIRHWPGILG